MKRLFTIFLTTAIAVSAVQAEQISPAEAEAIALQFTRTTPSLQVKTVNGQSATAKIAYTATRDSHNLLYVVNSGNGYVVVAGDDAATPILGYTTNGTFDYDQAPYNFKSWLSEYERQIEYMIENGITSVAPMSFDTEAEPLITTHWNQDDPYNQLCPILNGQRTYTGCVATAMAQVMKYHEWPERGIGSNSYFDSSGCLQTLSADFGSTTYQWDLMEDNYNLNSSDAACEAVATLMYHCGVSVEMAYSEDASGAFSNDAAQALVENFGYPADVQIITRDCRTYSEWVGIIKNEIDNNRPVYFSGQSTMGGHAFIIDGYNREGYFHVNWGWGGQSDGYYLVNTLNPYDGQGIGGGNGGFMYDQAIIINVEPPTGNEKEIYEITTSGIETPQNTAKTGENISISYGLLFNQSRQTINALVGFRVVDANGEIALMQFDSYAINLGPNYFYYGWDCTLSIPSDFAAGNYIIYPTYRMVDDASVTGDIHVQNGSSPYIVMVVDEDGNIELSNSNAQTDHMEVANIKLIENPKFISGQTTTLTVDITNNSDEDYAGLLSFALIDDNDKVVCSPLYVTDGQPAIVNAGETENVTLSLKINDFEAQESKYSLAIVHLVCNPYNATFDILGEPQTIKIGNATIRLNGAPKLLPSNDEVDCNNVHVLANIINESGTDEYSGLMSAAILVNGHYTTIATQEVSIEAGMTKEVEFEGVFETGEQGESYDLFIVNENGSAMMPYAKFTVATEFNKIELSNHEEPQLLPSNDEIDCNNVRVLANIFNRCKQTDYNGTVSAAILLNGTYTIIDTQEVSIAAGCVSPVNFEGPFEDGEEGKTYELFILDENGTAMMPSASFTVATEYTSINDALTTKLGVYPNPTSDLLNIAVDKAINNVAVYSITGSQVATFEGNGETTMQVSLGELPCGTYFVRINTVDGVKTFKAVKK